MFVVYVDVGSGGGFRFSVDSRFLEERARRRTTLARWRLLDQGVVIW